MPGHIESVPFLSQLEDVDKYLSEYRNLKIMSQATRNFGPLNTNQMHQIRYQNGNENNHGFENESAEYGKGGNRSIQMGNYSNVINKNGNVMNGNNNSNTNINGNNKNINGGATMNRKKYSNVNNNQVYRFNNAANGKYTSQKQQHQQSQQTAAFNHTPMMVNHFKQAYPQLYYNASNNGSNSSLDQLNTSFYGSNHVVAQQQPISSNNSSPSLVLPKLDTPLSGNSSIASYNGSFDPVAPMASEFNTQFIPPTNSFSNYLGNGILNSGSIATTPGSSNTSTNMSSARNDLLPNFAPPSLINDASSSQPVGFNNETPNQSRIPDGTVSNPLTVVKQENSLNNIESYGVDEGSSNGSSQLFMNDFTISWGSNHANASSSNSGSFNIWNNDMSVWS